MFGHESAASRSNRRVTNALIVVASRRREKGEEGERVKTIQEREDPPRWAWVGKDRPVEGEVGWKVKEEGRRRVRRR